MIRALKSLTALDRHMVKTALLVALAIVAVSLVFWVSARIIGVDENGLLAQAFVRVRNSPFAAPAVIAAFVAASFIGAPQFVLIAITVAAFGPVKGFMLSYVATLVSAAVNFQLARLLGAERLRARGWTRVDMISQLVSRNGFFASMLVRIIPSAPFIVVNMALGLTSTSLAAFLAGTAVGIIPKMSVIALLGEVVAHAQQGDPQAIGYLVLAATIWLALAFLTRHLVLRFNPPPPEA